MPRIPKQHRLTDVRARDVSPGTVGFLGEATTLEGWRYTFLRHDPHPSTLSDGPCVYGRCRSSIFAQNVEATGLGRVLDQNILGAVVERLGPDETRAWLQSHGYAALIAQVDRHERVLLDLGQPWH